MLLINLKFCIMRFRSEVIPLMLPFKNILGRGVILTLSQDFSEQLNKEKTQDNYQNSKYVPNFRREEEGHKVTAKFFLKIDFFKF